jgi:hypothetical protein
MANYSLEEKEHVYTGQPLTSSMRNRHEVFDNYNTLEYDSKGQGPDRILIPREEIIKVEVHINDDNNDQV